MIPTIETWETSIPLTLKTLSTTAAMSSWFTEGIMSWIQALDLGVLRAGAAPPGENPFSLILTSVQVYEAVGFGTSQRVPQASTDLFEGYQPMHDL